MLLLELHFCSSNFSGRPVGGFAKSDDPTARGAELSVLGGRPGPLQARLPGGAERCLVLSVPVPVGFLSLATQGQGGSPGGITEPPGHVSMTTAQPRPSHHRLVPALGAPGQRHDQGQDGTADSGLQPSSPRDLPPPWALGVRGGLSPVPLGPWGARPLMCPPLWLCPPHPPRRSAVLFHCPQPSRSWNTTQVGGEHQAEDMTRAAMALILLLGTAPSWALPRRRPPHPRGLLGRRGTHEMGCLGPQRVQEAQGPRATGSSCWAQQPVCRGSESAVGPE